VIDFPSIARLFEMRADFVHAAPYGSGRIHDTYCAEYDQAGRTVRYIHQRLNTRVFQDPVALMRNIERVTRHAIQRLRELDHPQASRRSLSLIPSRDGRSYAVDAAGRHWRTYAFIEGALGYDAVSDPLQARSAARAFGEFQTLLADLDPGTLTQTIPDFHHTPRRFEALEQAAERHPQRARDVAPELDFVRARQAALDRITAAIARGMVPIRLAHHDTKLNNVLLDTRTMEGVCVIDLDTTMPGSVLYDFGDMVRTMSFAGEAGFRIDLFAALVDGYLTTARDFLLPTETDLLVFAGELMTLECGMRFLTDHLEGDHYFKVDRHGQNLDRSRRQFARVEALEARRRELEDRVAQTMATVE
jgi:Ser/Thr protein kinase RdoA (MazF antagonist)